MKNLFNNRAGQTAASRAFMRGASIPGAGVRLAFLLLVLTTASSGCSSTKIMEVWKDDAFQGGRFRKVLVITAANTATVRRSCESEFVRLLRNHGINAVESFSLLPDESMNDSSFRDSVVATIQEQGIDAVLMTRSIGTRTSAQSIPGITVSVAPFSSYGAWTSYYGASYTFPASPPSVQGVTYERTYIIMETSLFDVKTGKPVWSARSETFISRVPEEEVKPYIHLVAKKMFSSHLF